MNTKIVIAGIVVLVVGVVLIAAGAAGVLARTTIFNSFSQPSSGEFVSPEIILNTSSVVDVRSPATSGGLIPAADLANVTSSNLGSYAINHNSTTANTDTYTDLKGSYYYVAFSSTTPNTIVVAVPRAAGTARYGLVALAGIILLIAGIVLAVVGALSRGNKKKSGTVSESDYYANRQGPPTNG
jgi:uncharacterized membrane protein